MEECNLYDKETKGAGRKHTADQIGPMVDQVTLTLALNLSAIKTSPESHEHFCEMKVMKRGYVFGSGSPSMMISGPWDLVDAFCDMNHLAHATLPTVSSEVMSNLSLSS